MLTLLTLCAVLLVARAVRRRRRTAVPARRGRLASVLVVGAVLGGQALIGSPATAQIPGVDDCKEAPNPERPGSGMVGAIDPSALDAGTPDSVYREVGYAGLVWHTYDLGCGPSGIRNPDAVIDTWTGNQLFNVAKVIVAASNGLHYALSDGGLLAPLDDLIVSGTVALYDSVYAPWVGLVAVVLAIVMFRYIWRGDLATLSRRTLWALAGIWFAAATYLTPLLYTQVLVVVLVDGSNQVRTGFLSEVGIEQRDALPTLLHEQIVYRNWARGEFGSPDGPQAQELGRDLVRAQAYTKQEIQDGADAEGSGVADQKRAAYEELAGRMGSSYGYFQGVDGNRIGSGLLATAQAVMFALFQLLAQAALLMAQILLRVVILLGPVIGLIAILYHELLRSVGRAVGAALLNVVVLSALAALHTLVMVWVFDPARGLGVLPQMLLGGLITLVMLLVARPVRRMWQMVELSVGAVGGAVPSAPGVLSRLRRRAPGQEQTAADRFWAEAREDGPATETSGGERVRPEATPESPVVAVAHRMDRPDGSAAALSPSSSRPGPNPAGAVSGADLRSTRTAAAALPVGHTARASLSRTVDSPPVVESVWDRQDDDDSVLVPSRSSVRRDAPRRAELEVVAGRPVWMVYRPSSGLVVGDDGSGRAGR